MADIQKTVEIVFGGKNELTKTIDEIGKSINSLDVIASKTADPLAKMGESLIKADAALAALAVGGMALAVRESSNFNASFALISTSIDATGGDLAKYRDDILAYSTTSSKSLEDINAALYTAAQAGIKWGDSLEFMRKAEELAVANKASLNNTVDLLTGTMNAYGFSLKDVAHINDVFFTSTLIGKQTIDELGTSMGSVVAIAANSGVSFEELSAAIATLTAKGMKTEDAITAVKNVITTIIAPSKEAGDAAAKLGLNFSLTELTAKGFSNMLHEIMLKTGGSKEQMVGLFNEVRAMNGALQITGDGMKFFDGALTKINGSAGTAAENYAKMAATFTNQSQGVINAAKGMLITLGTELEPIAAKVAGSLGALFAGVKIGVDKGAFDPLFKYLDQVGTSIADWLNAVAKAFPDSLKNVDFTGLMDALKQIGEMFKGLAGGTSSKDLAGSIQTVVDSIASLISITKGIGEIFAPILNSILAAVKAFNNLDSSTKELAGNLFGLGAAYKMFGPLSLLMIAFGTDTEEATKFFSFFAGAVDNGINVIKVALLAMALAFSKGTEAMAGLLNYVPGYDASAGIKRTAEQSRILSIELDKAQGELMESTEKLWGIMDGTATAAGKAKDKVKEIGTEAKAIAGKQMLEIMAKLDPTSSEKAKFDIAQAFFQGDRNKIMLLVALANYEAAEAARKLKEAIPEEYKVGVEVLADSASIETTKDVIIKKFPDGTLYVTNIGTKADDARLAETKKKIEDAIPKDKLIEIQAKLDVEKIKAQSDIVQKSVEWEAKLKISNVEADTARLKSAFDSINNTINSTGTSLSSLINVWAGLQGKGGTSFIEGQIAAENARRDEALRLQKELTEAEIANIKARTEAMSRGDSMITINGAGLQPHLEAFMFEILKAIQVRANAEGQKFLVGA